MSSRVLETNLIRQITTGYLRLPLHQKIQLAKEMGYWEDSDLKLSDTILGIKLFQTAKKRGERQKLMGILNHYL